MYRIFGDLIPIFLIGFVLLTVVLLLVNWKKIRMRNIDWPRLLLGWFFLSWLLGVGLITLVPLSWGISGHSISLIPLQELILHGPGIGYSVIKEGAANVFLFVIGAVVLSVYRRATAFQTALFSTGIALVIEVMQYVLAVGRVSSIDDLLWAFVGGLLGGAVGVWLQKRLLAGRKVTAEV